MALEACERTTHTHASLRNGEWRLARERADLTSLDIEWTNGKTDDGQRRRRIQIISPLTANFANTFFPAQLYKASLQLNR